MTTVSNTASIHNATFEEYYSLIADYRAALNLDDITEAEKEEWALEWDKWTKKRRNSEYEAMYLHCAIVSNASLRIR